MKYDIDKILENETSNDEKYNLKPVENCCDNDVILMELCEDNVKKVEAMLRYNSSYLQFSYEAKTPKELFEETKSILDAIKIDRENDKADNNQYDLASTSYIKAFKYLYLDGNKKCENAKKYYDTLIYIILRKINSENRTRVSLKTIDAISDAICEKFSVENVSEFIKALKEPAEVSNHFEREYKLIDIISEKYKIEDKMGKSNFSLATKFCHFFAFYLFDEGKYRDGFSIYDYVVKDNLEYYYSYYVKQEDKENLKKFLYDTDKNYGKNTLVFIYQNYQYIIDKILDSIDNRISRNGFDHIVWYTNKGRKR